jgi:hypothetical protein
VEIGVEHALTLADPSSSCVSDSLRDVRAARV